MKDASIEFTLMVTAVSRLVSISLVTRQEKRRGHFQSNDDDHDVESTYLIRRLFWSGTTRCVQKAKPNESLGKIFSISLSTTGIDDLFDVAALVDIFLPIRSLRITRETQVSGRVRRERMIFLASDRFRERQSMEHNEASAEGDHFSNAAPKLEPRVTRRLENVLNVDYNARGCCGSYPKCC